MALSRYTRCVVLAALALAVTASGCVTHGGYGTRHNSAPRHGYRPPRPPVSSFNAHAGPGREGSSIHRPSMKHGGKGSGIHRSGDRRGDRNGRGR